MPSLIELLRHNNLNELEAVIRKGKAPAYELQDLIEMAIQRGQNEAVQLLAKYLPVDNLLLITAIKYRNIDALHILLKDAKYVLRKNDQDGMPVLTYILKGFMTYENKKALVDILLKSVVKNDINEFDHRRMTALSYAIANEYDEIVTALLNAGADLHLALEHIEDPEDRNALLQKYAARRSPTSLTRAQTVISRTMRSRLKSLEKTSERCENYLMNAPEDHLKAFYEYVTSGHTMSDRVPDFKQLGAMTVMPAAPFQSTSGAMIRLSDVFLKMFQLIEGAPPQKALKVFRSMNLESFRRDRAAQVVQAHPVSTTTHSSFAINWHHKQLRECCLFEIAVPANMPVLTMCIPMFLHKSRRSQTNDVEFSTAQRTAHQILRNDQFEMLLCPCAFKVTGERKVKITQRNHPDAIQAFGSAQTAVPRDATLIQVEAKPVTVYILKDVKHPDFEAPLDVLYVPRHLTKAERALVRDWTAAGKVAEVAFRAPPSASPKIRSIRSVSSTSPTSAAAKGGSRGKSK